MKGCQLIANPANDGDSFHVSVGEKEYVFRLYFVDGDLGEQLVRNGLARVYGFKRAPPGSRESRAELVKLQQFEDTARQEKIGAWGADVGRLNVRAANASQFTVFTSAEKPQSRAAPAAFPAVLSSTPNSTVQIPPFDTPAPHLSRAKENTPFAHIDVNTATEKELRTVPGVGPVMAVRIIAARPFRSADDLRKVNGIGEKNYAKIRRYFQ